MFLFDWLTMALFRALRGSPGANLKLRVCIRALTSVTSGEFGLLWCLSNSGLSYNLYLTNASHVDARTSDPDRTTTVRLIADLARWPFLASVDSRPKKKVV